MLLYTTSEIINPDDNNFELLANVYELLTYPEHIKKALDKVIEMENAVEFSNHPRPKTKIKKNDLH